MTVKCCGALRTSRFCPECGKELVTSPLADLLAHCRQGERKLRAEAKNWRDTAQHPDQRGRTDGYPQRCEERAAHVDRRADRWKGWIDALAAVVAAPADGGDEHDTMRGDAP